MFEAHHDGLAPTHVPEEVTVDAYAPGARPELIESFALFELEAENFIIGHATLRNFGHFGGVTASELATDLAVADAGKHLELFSSSALQTRQRQDAGKKPGDHQRVAAQRLLLQRPPVLLGLPA